jgi:PAS domain S-box-containing protein
MQAVWLSLPFVAGFIPHGHCYLWKPGLVWLHLSSDALIALAYYSIPFTLLYCVRKRQDIPFGWMFQYFSAFIIACGTTHLFGIWTLWHPDYWLSGIVKALTAGVSLYTAMTLVSLVPSALSLPSSAQLEMANRELAKEIAERKQVEEDLRRSEARYRAVVEDQTELICRFLPDGTLTFVNEAYCRYFGRSQESLVGYTYAPVVLKDDLEYVQQQLETLDAENPVITFENRVIRPDGEIRTHQWINHVIVDQDDRPIEVQSVGRDVTELKQAEAALQKSQRFVQKIADTAPVILYVYDLVEKCNVYINREFTELLGYTSDDIHNMAQEVLPNLIHPEDFSSLQRFVQQWATAEDGDVLQFEYRMRHRNGNWQYFQCQETVFARATDGTPKQILGAAVDVSDHKLVQQLQAALKEKEVLIKEIHHRVKNNLQIVYSLLRLQQRKLTDEKAKVILLDSQNRVKTIALLHEKLYRSESLCEVDLRHYICQIATGLFSAYQVHSDSIGLETEIEPISFDIDTAILCGLIINELVSNSLKYAFSDRQTGKILIKICLERDKVVHLLVGDDGIGFSTDIERAGANSLGLKLVSDLVTQLEGTLSISSQQGVEFQISFPWRKQ